MDHEPEAGRGLTSDALSGALVTTVGMGAQSVLQIGVLVVLARLVAPEEFGLISAAMVVVAFSNLFVSIGVGPALIQREKLEQRHLDSAFALSLVLGVVVCAIVLLCAPWIAAGFRMDRLTNVLRVLSASFVITAPGVVAYSLLARNLRFGALALLGLASYFVGYGVVGVTLALLHTGVWALVAASLTQTAVATAIALVIERTGFRLSLRAGPTRDLLGYGAGFTIGGVAGYFAENLDNIVVGRLLGAQALGYYGRAFQFLSTPAQWLGMVSDKVIFPILSRVRVDRGRLEPAYRRCLSLVALGAIPATVALVVLAPEIVRVLLGTRWTEVILPFQILALGMLPRVSSKLAKSVAKATGVVFASAWRQSLYAALVACGAWLGSYRGLPGVAAGVIAAAVLNYGMMAQLTIKSTGISWLAFAKAHSPGFAVAVVWLGFGWPCAYALRLARLPDIAVLLLVGALLLLVIAGLWVLMPRVFLGEDGRWAVSLLREKFHARGERG